MECRACAPARFFASRQNRSPKSIPVISSREGDRRRAKSSRWKRSTEVSSVSSQFYSLYRHDFVRLASCVPRIEVGDPDFNFVETMRLAAQGDAAKAVLMVFPELGLSSYA